MNVARMLLATTILLGAPFGIQAQTNPVRPDSGARQNPVVRTTVPQLLRQERGSVPRTVRDSIGDALARIALASPGPANRAAHDRGIEAMWLLAEAGFSGGGRKGQRYEGVVERLIHIARSTTDESLRRSTNTAMIGAGPIEPVLTHLLSVATSSDARQARFAMSDLTHCIAPGYRNYEKLTSAERETVRTALRSLWERARQPGEMAAVVPDENAQRVLGQAAAQQKWPGIPRSPG